MPQFSTTALVLAAAPLHEQDKLVTLLTSEQGLLKAVAPGAARMKNRFGSLLEPFTDGDFHYYWREDRELATLCKGEIRRSFFPVVSAAGDLFHFFFLAEIALRFLQPNQRDTRIYKLLLAVLQAREQGVASDWLLPYFMSWLLRSEGLLFHPRRCVSCGRRGLQRAWLRHDFRGLLCSDCRRDEPWALGQDELEFIAWTAGQPPAACPAWTDRFDPVGLTRALTAKIEHHGEFSVRSRRYLPAFR